MFRTLSLLPSWFDVDAFMRAALFLAGWLAVSTLAGVLAGVLFRRIERSEAASRELSRRLTNATWAKGYDAGWYGLKPRAPHRTLYPATRVLAARRNAPAPAPLVADSPAARRVVLSTRAAFRRAA